MLDVLYWLALILYCLVGPLLAGAIAFVAHLGRRKMDRLRRGQGVALPSVAPRVTVLVPVKDEAAGIEACLRRLVEQDYPADRFDLLVVDDRSTDGTGAILDRLAGEMAGRLKVLHINDLPEGWLGKPHALHHAVTTAGDDLGEWLLLVDSDVLCDSSVLRRTVALAESRGYAFVSLLTSLVAPTLTERIIGPAAAATWLTTFRASETNNDHLPERALANGQFLLVRREALRDAGGHAAVRDKTCEDVELARRVKANGQSVRLLLGGHLTRTRMHADWGQLFNGWARNFAGTARHRPGPLVVTIVLLALSLTAYPVAIAGLATESWAFALAGFGHALACWTWFTMAYVGSGQSRAASALLALLYPLAAGATILLLANGIRACLGGTVRWRGGQVRA